jgi:hypothetical protein
MSLATKWALAIGASVLIIGPTAIVQTHPSFAGTWIVDVAKTASASGRAGTGRAGAPITITQDAATLVATRTNGETTNYRLDGKEVANATPPASPTRGANPRADLPNPGTAQVFQSVWQGAKLVTTMTGRGASGPTVATETRWMEGEWMVTETTRKTADADRTTRLYWKRVKTPSR